MNSHPPGEGPRPVLMLIVGRVDLMELNESVTRLEGQLGREINYTVFDEAGFSDGERRPSLFDPRCFGGRTSCSSSATMAYEDLREKGTG